MKKIAMVLPFVMGGFLAKADVLTCSGSDYGYDFTVTANVSGATVTGAVTATVTQSGSVVTTQTLQATASEIEPGQSIQVTANNSQVTGTIKATYKGGTYDGDLDTSTSSGSADVAVTCVLN